VSDVPTLDELLEHAWTHLVRGAKDRKHGFHTPVVSTVAGGRPRARVVVLRQASRERSELVFHTDARSAKLDELAGGVAWTLYDARRKLQVRAWGPAVRADPERTNARWDATSLPSRKGYLIERPPGTPVEQWTSGHTGRLDAAVVPTREESIVGRANFAVIVTRVEELEVLVLERRGHQRARYTADGGTWLVP
jgi:pyridoxine/pyridoxamine 5'-phosphate oxidase